MGSTTTPRQDETTHWHDAELDFAKKMSYGDYLELDAILNAQHPRSDDRNEWLFIVQHQTSELWMKLALHEMHGARECIAIDELEPAEKMLTRVSRIMEQLVQAWNVLSTMTASEYSAMRPSLGMSSGFQSYQYREIEFLLGNKNPAMLHPHAHRPELLSRLTSVLTSPSLYDEVIRVLSRQGFQIDRERIESVSQVSTTYDASVEAAWLAVYRDPRRHWALYALAEKLLDIEDVFRQWRFRHVTTVERVIGFKRGTGGTEGVGYLRKMLDVVLFPELWRLRTSL